MYWSVILNSAEAAWPAALGLGASFFLLLLAAAPSQKQAAVSPILAAVVTFLLAFVLAAWPASRDASTSFIVVIAGSLAILYLLPRSIRALRNRWVGVIHLLTAGSVLYLTFILILASSQ